MSDPLERMARSTDWTERASAARQLARRAPGDAEEIVLRLLRDPGSTEVSQTMVAALLEARREGAVRLLLRSLGQDEGGAETTQCILEGLLSSELDGVEMRAALLSVLQEAGERHELLGALRAIGWLAPSGGFPAPPEAFAHVSELSNDSDAAIRAAAQRALTALSSQWRQPDVP
ncbi:MAG TPA: HEAT repeat domain-containing protein [Gaiellales bacterium]|nr:HEAT repeat domain-containing protein [Gaiellales bacterium]